MVFYVLGVIFYAALVLGGLLSALLVLASIKWREQSGDGRVQVVVLGDVGRSPRMQYHCLSLVQLKYKVDLVGYGGTFKAFWSKLNCIGEKVI